MFDSLPICRVCLKTSLEYIDFDTPFEVDANATTKTDNGLTYLDCFQACTRIEIEFDENCPQSLCSSCGFELKIAFEFLQKAESADKTLRQLQCGSTKMENIDDDDDEMKCILESESANQRDERNTKKLEEDVDSNMEQEKTYVCTVCGEQFFSQTVLNLHVNRLHTSKNSAEEHVFSAVDKVECQICETILPVANLDAHMQTHEEESNFEDKNDESTMYEEEVVVEEESGDIDEVEFEVLDMVHISAEDNEEPRTRHDNDSQEVTTGEETYETVDCDEEEILAQVKNETTRSDGVHDTDDPDTDGNSDAEADADADENENAEFDVIAKIITQEETLKRSKTHRFKQCEICSKQIRISSYETHMNVHNGVRQFQCEFCFQAYFSKRSLQKHLKVNHIDSLTSTCSICNETVDYNDLKAHIDEKHSHRVKCDQCDYECVESKLKDHMKRKHSESKDFLCNVCSKTFSRMGSLKCHLQIHERETNEAHETYPCDMCSKKFPSRALVRMHKKTHAESRPRYSCEECGKSYLSSSSLKLHQRWHTGETFQCALCPKLFVTNPEYKIHLRFHTRDYPHQCEMCGKKFNAKGHLNSHLKMHLGWKIKCKVCGKLFATRAAYTDHAFKHSEMPYKCLHCPKGYPTYTKLRFHLKTTHSMDMPMDEIKKIYFRQPTGVPKRERVEWIKCESSEANS